MNVRAVFLCVHHHHACTRQDRYNVKYQKIFFFFLFLPHTYYIRVRYDVHISYVFPLWLEFFGPKKCLFLLFYLPSNCSHMRHKKLYRYLLWVHEIYVRTLLWETILRFNNYINLSKRKENGSSFKILSYRTLYFRVEVDIKLSIQKLLNAIICFVEFYSNNCLFQIKIPCKSIYFVMLMQQKTF